MERETLECRWKRLVQLSIERGDSALICRVNQGDTVVSEYTDGRLEEEKITFISTIQSTRCVPPLLLPQHGA